MWTSRMEVKTTLGCCQCDFFCAKNNIGPNSNCSMGTLPSFIGGKLHENGFILIQLIDTCLKHVLILAASQKFAWSCLDSWVETASTGIQQGWLIFPGLTLTDELTDNLKMNQHELHLFLLSVLYSDSFRIYAISFIPACAELWH